MGPAPANPTAHRDEHGGAQRNSRKGSWQIGHSVAVPAIPNPLPGRWFGCPGAGPIRACHRLFTPTTVLMSQSQFANPVQRERGPENGYPDRRPCQCFSEHVNGQQPWGMDRDDLALAGGVVCVLRPTLAGAYLWLVDVTASTPCLARHCVGNREWGLRPQTPPPTEMSASAVPAVPNPLPGRWFGCPGADPIRACHREGAPTTALMS